MRIRRDFYFRLLILILGFGLSCACSAYGGHFYHRGVLRGRFGLFFGQGCGGNIVVADVKAASMLQAEAGKGLIILPFELLTKFFVSEQGDCIRINSKSGLQLLFELCEGGICLHF